MNTPSEAENEMRRRFEERARVIAASASKPVARTVGLEAEYPTVSTHDGRLVEQSVRDAIIAGAPDMLTCEMGAAQLELRTDPVDLDKEGLAGIEAAYNKIEQQAAGLAARQGAGLVRIGSYPACRIDQISRTKKEKYTCVPGFHDSLRGPYGATSAGLLDPACEPKADIIALMNSVQFNLAVAGPQEAVDLLNLSMSIVPVISALTGNANFLQWKNTGYEDIRMVVWERSHDSRTLAEVLAGQPLRIGNPHRYFSSFEDYLAFASSFPFILNKP
ncbi:MAG: glutamate-cysteine ligase family protein, partial [Elusimicrobiota bacterium]|nr:glutamate-cysteine ligase family protein [Elusimicrobiota bacterium]